MFLSQVECSRLRGRPQSSGARWSAVSRLRGLPQSSGDDSRLFGSRPYEPRRKTLRVAVTYGRGKWRLLSYAVDMSDLHIMTVTTSRSSLGYGTAPADLSFTAACRMDQGRHELDALNITSTYTRRLGDSSHAGA